ncbi:MAG: hypothetical protein JOZ78_02615 [Chroococcidiopsidaceae cyanobacterium CP_BM_ER_R8_30]|nr:hypothetical protein [Chroococcidiopsidaceae cyanobacterium CP_BM_ER_R8_30]
MAKLPDEILTTIFTLQRQLLERIDEATATEFALFAFYGEIEETTDYFEQLQNARERADSYYLRLFTTLRQIYPSQPVASRDSLELLAQFITDAQATVNAVEATISEIRRDFNL